MSLICGGRELEIESLFWKVPLKFSDLNLHPSLASAVEKLNYGDCTPIQEQTIPHLLEGRDVAGLAQTGTGKTAAFLLPIMERITRSRLNPDELNDEEKALREERMFPDWRSNQFVLVLVPTRELAEQVYESACKFQGETGIRAVSIYGGVSYDKQKQGLRDSVEIVVATPGRLIDLFKENLLDLKQVRAIIFDEADRMFDMGFKDDMKFILQRVPKERQFLVFSATLNLDVMNTAYQFGANPVEVNVSRDQAKAENVDDKIFHVGQDEKGSHLLSVLRLHKPKQAIIFSNFKMNVPRIAQFLNDNGIPTVGISSLLTQSQRTRVMEQFKGESEHNVLVATDVAARGLDIKGVDMVVNFELPDDAENYVHRIGRTGRAGAKGLAFSLVSDRDVDSLSRIEDYLKHKVEIGFLEEGEIVKEFKAMPSESRGGGARSGGSRGASQGGRGGDRGPRSGGDRSSRSPREGGRDGGRGRGAQREAGPITRPTAAGAATGVPGEARPPRAEGAKGEGRGPGAPRGEGRAPRAPRADRPLPPGGRAQAAAGAPGEARSPRGEGRRDGRGARGNDKGARTPGGSNGSRPQARGANTNGNGSRPNAQARGAAKSGGPTPNSPSIGKKVSGFFKRLFGG